jgi:hypothetical protein
MEMEKKTSVLREVHDALGEMWDHMIELRHGCFDWCATHRRGGNFPFQIDCGEMDQTRLWWAFLTMTRLIKFREPS